MSVLCVSCLPVEILQGLVSGSLRGSLGQVVSSPAEQEGMVGPVSLPRRAETFGGFDSHQMNVSKGQWGGGGGGGGFYIIVFIYFWLC